MANSKQAKKRVRQTARRTEVNRNRRSSMRTFIRKVEDAISAGDQNAARDALRVAQPVIARAGQKGILHGNTASRKISRLNKRIASMGA